MPPITTVPPSATVIFVSADSVSRAGIPERVDTGIDLRILHQHIHENRAFGGDLRGDFQFQDGVNELHRDGVIDGRLNRNLGTLLDDRLLVVLRDDLGL